MIKLIQTTLVLTFLCLATTLSAQDVYYRNAVGIKLNEERVTATYKQYIKPAFLEGKLDHTAVEGFLSNGKDGWGLGAAWTWSKAVHAKVPQVRAYVGPEVNVLYKKQSNAKDFDYAAGLMLGAEYAENSPVTAFIEVIPEYRFNSKKYKTAWSIGFRYVLDRFGEYEKLKFSIK